MRLRGKCLLVLLPLALAALSLTGCVSLPAPIMVGATPGDHSATVNWLPPLAAPAPIVAYVVIPIVGNVAQPSTRFDSTATTETVTGLRTGVTYRFQVVAINSLGDETAPSGASNAVEPAPPITAGADHTCALVTSGVAKCWGRNVYGQLGDGTNTERHTPVDVAGITTATAITAGAAHTCAALDNGTVKCWGNNTVGQLGNGTNTNSTTPLAVTGITNATAISAGWVHTCALFAAGTVKCWGQNIHGELGDGSNNNSTTPVAVTGITTATAITAGAYHTCALLTGGTAKCWGWNGYGQLGNGTTGVFNPLPVAVTGITTALAITAGGGHTCALLTGGIADCWGDNGSGQLGDGTTTNSSTPVAVTGMTTASAITAGHDHSCALLVGGTVDCWGYNSNGQLGHVYDGAANPTPVAVTGLTTAVVITAGAYDTCALLTGGIGKCWGDNGYGALGDGTTTNSAIPVTVSGL